VSLPSPSEAIAAKARRKLARTEALAWLAAGYPVAFGPDVKLLALGVGRLIWPRAKAAGVRCRALNDAIKWRTGSIHYLDALAAAGAMRCDLTGNVVEPVSVEHREIAFAREDEIARRIESFSKRSIVNDASTADSNAPVQARI
jgi:sRNA-binding protein